MIWPQKITQEPILFIDRLDYKLARVLVNIIICREIGFSPINCDQGLQCGGDHLFGESSISIGGAII